MIFRETELPGAKLIDLDRKGDERGFFARLFCQKEFGAEGLETGFVQVNTSLSARAGTLRGMHYQLMPSAEVKIVRCIRGALWDCIVDLRPHSPTLGKWFGATLSAENRTMMYVPRGFAHGFITLTDDTEAFYLVSAFYAPEQERGLRWDDPFIAIEWPREPIEISVKDREWPFFDPAYHGVEGFRFLAPGLSASNDSPVQGVDA
ncbi:dTDP-4-dehydrorhamnose 3,5-epimerase [Brucella sp. IR073]|uniref:dTDP-4-dehydrorhamnose 3,5-epimerase n=1 Tax=unclassified Brucella TaxID=2632610 RepID=UPI003B984E19